MSKRIFKAKRIKVSEGKYLLFHLEPSMWEMIDFCAKRQGITYQAWIQKYSKSYDGQSSMAAHIRNSAQTEVMQAIKDMSQPTVDDYIEKTINKCIEKFLVQRYQ